jgi:hypothetical protein
LAADTPERALEQATALGAALAALKPIVALLLDAGINTAEVTRFVRWAFVEEAASRQRKNGKKPSISRIAVATGLSRAEVSQLLASTPPTPQTVDLAPRASDKVIAAWVSDPDYLEPTGKPKALSYSDAATNFSALVRKYAPDIPPRAMLKEMVASNVVAEISGGMYLPAMQQGQPSLSQRDAVAAFGAKMNALGSTLLQVIQDPDRTKLFEAMVQVGDVSAVDDAKVTKELARRCRTFAHGVERYLLDQTMSGPTPLSIRPAQTIGVIVAVVEQGEKDSTTVTLQDD